MHERERFAAFRNDNRVVRDFDWGFEFADAAFIESGKFDNSANSAVEFWRDYTAQAVSRSNEFYKVQTDFDFQSKIQNPKSKIELSWTSQTVTASAENNTVRAQFFPAVKQPQTRKRAVIILPHWNAPAGSYIALCKVLARVGIAALRLTLPYHEERMPPELERADYLVSPNIGQTLQSIRQAVLDTRAAVKWLKQNDFDHVGLVGTSIGSCTGFLAAAHDTDINAAVFNHVSGFVGDVTWRGLSTYHVREALEKTVTLEQLREFWLPVSPMAYIEKLKSLPPRPLRFIYTLYDLTFPIDLSLDMMQAFRDYKIPHDETALPCGHYTLGEKPWVYIDGWKIVSFLHRNL